MNLLSFPLLTYVRHISCLNQSLQTFMISHLAVLVHSVLTARMFSRVSLPTSDCDILSLLVDNEITALPLAYFPKRWHSHPNLRSAFCKFLIGLKLFGIYFIPPCIIVLSVFLYASFQWVIFSRTMTRNYSSISSSFHSFKLVYPFNSYLSIIGSITWLSIS